MLFKTEFQYCCKFQTYMSAKKKCIVKKKYLTHHRKYGMIAKVITNGEVCRTGIVI